MPRGGYREGAGRKSEWVSSSKTTAIRIPSWMVDEILNTARKLDSTENIESIKNENSQSTLDNIIQKWKDKSIGKEDSPRWKNLHLMIEEIERELDKQ
jgi:hypothetical protein